MDCTGIAKLTTTHRREERGVEKALNPKTATKKHGAAAEDKKLYKRVK